MLDRKYGVHHLPLFLVLFTYPVKVVNLESTRTKDRTYPQQTIVLPQDTPYYDCHGHEMD